jgi:hypothetical protein
LKFIQIVEFLHNKDFFIFQKVVQKHGGVMITLPPPLCTHTPTLPSLRGVWDCTPIEIGVQVCTPMTCRLVCKPTHQSAWVCGPTLTSESGVWEFGCVYFYIHVFIFPGLAAIP